MNGNAKNSSTVRVYKDGELVKKQKVRGGSAPGYVGKRKASAAAKAAAKDSRRKAS